MQGFLSLFDWRAKSRQIAALKATNEQLQRLVDTYAERAFAATMQNSQLRHCNHVGREQLLEQIRTLAEELREVKAKYEISEGRFSIADLRKAVTRARLPIMLKTSIINLLDGEAKRELARYKAAANLCDHGDGSADGIAEAAQ